MRLHCLLLLFVLVLLGCSRHAEGGAGGGGGGPVDPVITTAPPQDELAKFKGTWTGSVGYGDAPGGKVTVEFTADTMTINFAKTGKSSTKKFRIDPSKNPKWIDLDATERTGLGIYSFEKDVLRITFGNHGKRPVKHHGPMGTITSSYRLTRK